jgi:hypothetical protein
MRVNTFGFIVGAAFLATAATARAQDLPPPSANSGSGSGMPETTPPPPAGPATVEALPPPVAGGPSGSDAANAAGSTVAAAPAVKAPSPSDWQFSWHGYFRAPLRLGVGHRDQCPPPGAMGATPNMMSAQMSNIKDTTGAPIPYGALYCAQNGQSRTTIHSPYIPDDQYLSWNFDRQWEQAWAEVFLSYGNDHVVGTVSIQGYDFTDTTLLGNQADPAQFGIGQAWLSVTPDLPVDGLRMNWKVGSFWEKFGMAGKYDGGHYDTYMFGRTHTMGESLSLEYGTGDWTFKAEHGFGAHLEMVPAGIQLSGSSASLNYYNMGANNAYPPGGSAGVTLLNHFHAGIDWNKKFQLNGHYMVSWSMDDRGTDTLTQGTLPGGNGNPAGPNGSLSVYGAEARFLGGVFGELYLGYSHIKAINVSAVGPAIEVVHSMGGGGHNGANGIYENFFNASGNGDGNIDTFQVGYDFSFGYLWRKIQHPNAAFWGDGTDVKLSLFAMYSAVSGMSTNMASNGGADVSVSPYNGAVTNGTKKLKYGADLVANLLPWFGVGVRGDLVQPDSHDAYQSFGVISPKLIFRTKFITHEEITAQYSHYWDGVDVIGQQVLAQIGTKNIGQSFTSAQMYPNDGDVFGIKGTMWW